MKKYKFSDLLLHEEKIRKLYQGYGLKLNSENRITQYFKYLREIEKSRQIDKEKFAKVIQKDKAKYYYSQFYVLEICNIINSLESKPQDEKIIRNKLVALAKGTFLLSEENETDTIARDTTFELSLFSFLQARGLEVNICDPNPDLTLKSDKFIYNIECKRSQSMKSLGRNIKKAVKQLKKSTGPDVIPTIALSIEQVLFQGKDLILDSRDEKTASDFLNKMLEGFLWNNLKELQRICGSQPCLVLYFLQCLVGFKTDVPMANATFISGNVYNFGSMTSSIMQDLNTMVPQPSI